MLASLPLTWMLSPLGREHGSHAWMWFFAFLAPTAAVALVSCVAVLRRRALGARLAPLLMAMVAMSAAVVVVDLPPAQAEFHQYRVAEIGTWNWCPNAFCALQTTDELLAACDRDSSCRVNDHAQEIRFNYSFGALALTGFYLWAVTGWTPRRRARMRVPA